MNCYVYPWENQNWDRQSAKTMKAGLLLLLINRFFFFHVRKKKLMGMVEFDGERLREIPIKLSDENFPMKNYADQKNEVVFNLIKEHSFKQIKH